MKDLMQWLRSIEHSARERERYTEAARIAATLPVSPLRVRQLLDTGLTPEQVHCYVNCSHALGYTP